MAVYSWIKFPNLNCEDFIDLNIEADDVALGLLCRVLITLNGQSKGLVRPRLGRGINIVNAWNKLSSVLEWTEKVRGTYIVTLHKSLIFPNKIVHTIVEENSYAYKNKPTPEIQETIAPTVSEVAPSGPVDGGLFPAEEEEVPAVVSAPVEYPINTEDIIQIDKLISRWSKEVKEITKQVEVNTIKKRFKQRGYDLPSIIKAIGFLKANEWVKSRSMVDWADKGWLTKSFNPIKHFNVKKDKPVAGMDYEDCGHPPVDTKSIML